MIWAEETHGKTGALWRNGGYFANSMLQWKFSYESGDLGYWSVGDVEEYLLNFAPRKMGLDEELTADGPDCVAGFLTFLGAEEYLDGDTLPTLIAHCEKLRGRFAAAAR